MNFRNGLTFFNRQTIKWGSNIGQLVEEWKPKRGLNKDQLTLIWGDVRFFGSVLQAQSIFFQEAIPVKDRQLEEVQLVGTITTQEYDKLVSGVIGLIGGPTGHLELPNLASNNWILDDFEVSTNYVTKTQLFKMVIRRS